MVNVRYTSEELAQVAGLAAAAGYEVTAFVGDAALRGPVRVESAPGKGQLAFRMTAPERRAWASEVMAIRRLVGVTANNINQLARTANATGQVPAEVGPSLAACERAMARLEVLLADLDAAR
jgi:hypothetical protein